MSLPLLKILGHEIANSEWEDNSKDVIWTAAVLAFFGSLRFEEMLGTGEWKYNPYETLLWSDIKIFENSALLHIKVTKNCSKEGEFVDIFPFTGHGCCPLAALINLKKSRRGGEWEHKPVFAFKSGKLLTQNTEEKNRPYRQPTGLPLLQRGDTISTSELSRDRQRQPRHGLGEMVFLCVSALHKTQT
jgi:hypothetical protein